MQISKLGAAFPLVSLGILTREWGKRKGRCPPILKATKWPTTASTQEDGGFFYKESIQRPKGLNMSVNPGGSWGTKIQVNFTESNVQHPLKTKILETVQSEHTDNSICRDEASGGMNSISWTETPRALCRVTCLWQSVYTWALLSRCLPQSKSKGSL